MRELPECIEKQNCAMCYAFQQSSEKPFSKFPPALGNTDLENIDLENTDLKNTDLKKKTDLKKH